MRLRMPGVPLYILPPAANKAKKRHSYNIVGNRLQEKKRDVHFCMTTFFWDKSFDGNRNNKAATEDSIISPQIDV